MQQTQFSPMQKIYLPIKRFIDIFLSLLGIIFLSPLFIILCIAIKVDSRGAIFFKQKREGIDKKTFMKYKFRTMRIDTPKDMPTHLLTNPEQYITKVGKILRKTSLDELPQLFNILKGEMSIIGPRPVILEESDLIIERDKYGANSVKPGLTGWAQVNGRDKLDNKTKAMYDGEYVENFGFVMDLKCFFKTIFLVFTKYGVIEGSENLGDKEDKSVDRVSIKWM